MPSGRFGEIPKPTVKARKRRSPDVRRAAARLQVWLPLMMNAIGGNFIMQEEISK